MNDMKPTYVSEDGITYGVIAGKVVAADSDFDEVERQVNHITAKDDCPSCDGSGKQKDGKPCTCGDDKSDHQSATHIVTPNGVKGQILSRTAGLWSDEVTVRFDNGQIHSVAVTDRTDFVTENHKVASSKPVDRLRTELSKIASDHSRKSLTDRLVVIGRLKGEARMLLASGVSHSDMQELHELVLTADHEIGEIKDGIDHIDNDEAEAFAPYKPEMQAIQGESVGHQNDGSWLDATLNDMLEEARGVDYDTLLDEGPTLLNAEQDDATVADGGAIREMALSHVRSKTAGLDGEDVDKFERLFVARCEDARRVELANRKVTTKKEAASKQSDVDNAPVESLFM
jgi:hypothetical protein